MELKPATLSLFFMLNEKGAHCVAINLMFLRNLLAGCKAA